LSNNLKGENYGFLGGVYTRIEQCQTKTNCWSEVLFGLNSDRIGCITSPSDQEAKNAEL